MLYKTVNGQIIETESERIAMLIGELDDVLDCVCTVCKPGSYH